MVLKAIAVHMIDRKLSFILVDYRKSGRIHHIRGYSKGLNKAPGKVCFAGTQVTKQTDNISRFYRLRKCSCNLLCFLYAVADLLSHYARGFRMATGRIISSIEAPPC